MLIAILIAVNLISFAAMGLDKKYAKQGKWRIPEKELFLLALFGGVYGAVAGMFFFHHKTKHWYFYYGLPTLAVLETVILIAVAVYQSPL